ncbi:MAG: hypothetical protein HY706_19980 [Candidatus Hydrogenedentes bacterium]|nr:hypothetical protein [Candidatus Hydrogenedentota bacterium]
MSTAKEDLEARYRRMLLSLSPGERVAMACRMFSTAVTLVEAGLRVSANPQNLNVRQRKFLRFYGRDFSEADQAKILKALGDP